MEQNFHYKNLSGLEKKSFSVFLYYFFTVILDVHNLNFSQIKANFYSRDLPTNAGTA